jgi:anti-sigma B factor antagonist
MDVTRRKPVIVKTLPEESSGEQAQRFVYEIKSCIQADRPRVVLDCSRVLQFDIAGIQVLLHCLEEAMKRNGDVKLAAIPPGAGKILERTGVVNLFEVFDNTLDAVESFHRLPLNTLREAVRPEYSTAAPEKRNTAGFLSKRLLESGSRLTVAAVTPMMRWLSPNRGNLD